MVFVFGTVHSLSLPFQEYAFLVHGILYPPAQVDYEYINQTNYDFEMMYVLLTSHVIFLLGKC